MGKYYSIFQYIENNIKMAKIAAVILPSSRADKLAGMRKNMSRMLAPAPTHSVEANTYIGQHAACMLMRVGPDTLNTASQPVVTEHGAGVACGYYSSPEGVIGDSATRLLKDVAGEGADILPRRDGVYAFACWDSRHERLVTGVDKLGMRPLFWAALPGGGYAVASEIKALFVLLEEPEINWPAWEEHLTFGFLFDNHTFFKEINRLGVAESITFHHHRHAERTIENFLESINIIERPMDVFLEEQHAVFDQAMLRLSQLYDAGEDTILTLSGGYDSRRILAWLLAQNIRPTAYTVPDVQIDGREFESGIVREICRATEIAGYSIYPATASDRVEIRKTRDISVDFESDEHNFYAMFAMLGPRKQVNFDGLAAGSQLSGSFLTIDDFKPGGKERFIARWPITARKWLDLPETRAVPPLEERIRAKLDYWEDNPNRFACFYLLSRTRREVALGPLSIQANAFESLCPFLDRELMQNALSYPPARKIEANVQMSLIAALHPALSRVPTAYSHSLISDPRYSSFVGKLKYSERRTLVRKALTTKRRNSPWTIGMEQKMRFRAANMLAALYSRSRWVRWEFGKAAKVAQLAHFTDIIRSSESYQAAVADLGASLAKRRGWSKPL